MSLALPYPQPPRLRAEPVAELSGFVASNKPAWQTAKHDTRKTQLPRHASSQSLLHCAKNTSRLATTAIHRSSDNGSSHERALEMLRTVLYSTRPPSSSDSDVDAAQHEAKSVESHASQMPASLETHRATFLETLYDAQDPAAESIAAINALLCNRVKLGLLDSVSASSYHARASQSADSDGTLAMRIGFVDESEEQQLGDGDGSGNGSGDISSSLNSNGSSDTLTSDDANASAAGTAETTTGPYAVDSSGDNNNNEQQQPPVQGTKSRLIEMWATNGFWRGVSTRAWSGYSQQERRRSSVCSGSTLAAGIGDSDADTDTDNIGQVAPNPSTVTATMPDEMGICWPLDDASSERTNSWGRFYADLGGLRIPTRYRTPNRSLAMLATEQRMMLNDKIVCPLKNRLQEPNPRRQQFEDYIRETGSLPLPQSTCSSRPLSPLCSQLH
ncbi:hypothetical protein IW140_000581 [Coemansia sp. RSA 1813]|nr:hypothetical protein EV178_002688 [Coemansia sp. RSA 1646]KAJ1774050.1 hypothetical protein LPJ74_000149 [Coemansia sp. RSA 1843]KAJ2092560.1 hypothetical protein IW138_000998 [Coemansia sp. RSA 986]KAJ2216746.1 hypothetical protein EV179_001036 [Coemansia sp. RSA 487]KAJ2572818.1 hypothetical protein IW140_000581 [Coemansia sp. RSA 1813]